MKITKASFIASICVATAVGLTLGIGSGIYITNKKYQNKIEEAEAMVEFWKRRAEKKADETTAEKISSEYDQTDEQVPERDRHPKYVKPAPVDYTKYYSRSSMAHEESDEDDAVDVIQDPKLGHDDPPRIVSRDEAMSPDVECIELEYHTLDEALVDPNTPGQTDLIDPVDAQIMVGNLLRLPDPSKLPNTIFVYCPQLDKYYEIFVYDNYWDPPEGEDPSPKVEKIVKKRRFDE